MSVSTRLALLSCAIGLLAASPTLAQSAPKPSASPASNEQKAPPRSGCQTGTPEGELACLEPDLREVEKSLERQVHRLDRLLRTTPRSRGTRAPVRLTASQAAFYDYRDHYCKLEGVAHAGTSEWLDVRVMECEMRITKDRLESLRDIEAFVEVEG